MRTLMLLRHGKSDWDSGIAGDFERPLAKRGRLAVKRMGTWMRHNDISPDYLICSPAERARATVVILCDSLGIEAAHVRYEDRLYLADVDELLQIVRHTPPEVKSVMLVGHNPGFEDFLRYLCGDELPTSDNGKLLPTASLAQITLPNDWGNLRRDAGRLVAITRPKEL